MSCFWNGIISAITIQQFKKVFPTIPPRNPTPKELITLLQQHAVKTDQVTWNGQQLSSQELDENLEAITSYDNNVFNQGYLCSACEPFLLLICQLFQFKIIHIYNGVTITYEPQPQPHTTPQQLIKFGSNKSHFWCLA